MPQGFFPSSMLVSARPIMGEPACGACGLYRTCNSPKMKVSGGGRRKILIIAEAPGGEEDKRGIQLIGPAGQTLFDALQEIGIEMRRDCWLTNSIICRPPKNREPTLKEIKFCLPNLVRTISELKPEVIIPLGKIAVKSLLGHYYSGSVSGIDSWIGWRIPHQKLNAWICPAWHPSFIMRKLADAYKSSNAKLAYKIWVAHLKAACNQTGRPWATVPNYRKQIKRIYNPTDAADFIRARLSYEKFSTFDFETNMLKPDSPLARIVSCSICWDEETTIAFPVAGEARKALIEYLKGPSYKGAANLKYEDRWARAVLETEIERWFWDTMVNAHIQDNREGITGLKFQSFVNFGFDDYNTKVERFLKAKGSYTRNRILEEVDMRDLLLYNGLDSLLELMLAFKQMKEFGYDPKQ